MRVGYISLAVFSATT